MPVPVPLFRCLQSVVECFIFLKVTLSRLPLFPWTSDSHEISYKYCETYLGINTVHHELYVVLNSLTCSIWSDFNLFCQN
jgi:hypothetical protein